MKKIKLTIKMLENNQVEEVKNILTEEQSEILQNEFAKFDGQYYPFENVIGQDLKIVAEYINEEGEDFIDDLLQRIIVYLFPNKYEGDFQ